MSTDYTEPFAYGIQAPIGSVTPLFHKRKDAEDFIAKLTDSRDEAKIIPLYRASTTIETMLECWHNVIEMNEELCDEQDRLKAEIEANGRTMHELLKQIDDLRAENRHLASVCQQHDANLMTAATQTEIDYQAEIDRLRFTDAEREAVEAAIDLWLEESQAEHVTATLRGLLERHRGKQ